MKLKSIAILALSWSLASAALAEDGWSGEASLGFLNTTGNTETRTLNAKGLAAFRDGRILHSARASALTSEKEDETTDERYSLGYKGTFDFTQRNYGFASLDYDNDRFAGIIERRTAALGYGRRLLTGPRHRLDVEFGVGATQQERAGSEDTEASYAGLFNVNYQWQITETSSFTQLLKVENSRNNTFINPVSTLKLVIAGRLFTTLGYEVRSNTEVPDGTRKTDTFTSINLGYSFGKKA